MATSHSDPHAPAAPTRREPDPRSCGHAAIQGHRLYWELHGPEEGPVLVLLHHGLGSVRAWRRQIPFFAGHGWQVLAFDRWGYGRSDPRPAFEQDFQRHDARQALALLQQLGVKRACLLGHSDGASIALLMAAERPDLVQALVLVATHIYRDPKTARYLEHGPDEAERARMSRGMQREHGEKAPQLLQAWLDRWLSPEMAAFDLTGELRRVRCPALVVLGEQDTHLSVEHARRVAQGLSRSRLWLIPDAGHMAPQEIPQIFNERVQAFLEEVGAPQATLPDP